MNMLYQYNKRVNNLLTPFKNRILANLKNNVLVFEVFAYVNKIDEIRPSFIFFAYKLQINDTWIFTLIVDIFLFPHLSIIHYHLDFGFFGDLQRLLLHLTLWESLVRLSYII